MRAMVAHAVGAQLVPEQRAELRPGRGEVRIRVEACGVCRTDLHLVDGELPQARLPVVPGHEIVGIVDAVGEGAGSIAVGERVGVPWLGRSCGVCDYCRAGRENLCDTPQFTGCTRDGGYAEQVVADAAFCLPLPASAWPEAASAAPLLCAGLIGWRALMAAGEGTRLGLYGFGAAAHILIQVARHRGWQVYAFTRPGDVATQDFARRLGAVWADDSTARPPQPLDAAILFAPAGELVPLALAAVRKGGRVVCGGIHMSNIPSFPYQLLWEERRLVSVANLTRADGRAFLAAAAQAGVTTQVQRYPLAEANAALADLRHGRFQGAAVLLP